MEINNAFEVKAPIDVAWATLTDLARIAPCLPGATLTSIEGDIYKGHVTVKVGPIVAKFGGQAIFQERNDAAHRAVLKGEGRDSTGKGNASAIITAQLESVDANTTRCTVNTDLTITGKIAQFGRGALADVSDKLLAQFSENLNQLISAAPAPSAPVVAEAAPAPSEQPTIRKIDGPEVAPLNLLDTAGSTIAKRAIPALIGIAVLVAVLVKLF